MFRFSASLSVSLRFLRSDYLPDNSLYFRLTSFLMMLSVVS